MSYIYTVHIHRTHIHPCTALAPHHPLPTPPSPHTTLLSLPNPVAHPFHTPPDTAVRAGTGQKPTGQDWTAPNRTRPDRTGQDRKQ